MSIHKLDEVMEMCQTKNQRADEYDARCTNFGQQVQRDHQRAKDELLTRWSDDEVAIACPRVPERCLQARWSDQPPFSIDNERFVERSSKQHDHESKDFDQVDRLGWPDAGDVQQVQQTYMAILRQYECRCERADAASDQDSPDSCLYD